MATETITFEWSRNHGDCYDCGRPAAFKVVGGFDGEIMCSVCAANHAADGESIEWIDPEMARS